MLSEAICSRRSLLAGLPFTLKAQSSRPNVLILHSDDQRFDTISAWGNPQIHTPNLDRLTRMGVSFRQFYNQGGHAGAVCIAARAMLLSGRSLWRATGTGGLNVPLLPERFAEAGYDTFFTGKWHTGKETLERCFKTGGRVLVGGMGPHTRPRLGRIGDLAPTEYPERTTLAFSNDLAAFLRSRSNAQNPFFAYCAFTAPHDPRDARPDDLKRYESRELALPRPWLPSPAKDNGELKVRDEVVIPAPRDRATCRRELAAYYALITEMDEGIGNILKNLEDVGQLSSTVVVFMGDNGLAMGAHGLMGKQSMYEHSLRVPLILAGPGIGRGKTDGSSAFSFELYSRLCRITGVSAPGHVENPGGPLYFGYRDFQRAVRIGSRKMAWSNQVVESYDLAKDPFEERDLGAADQDGFLAARRKAAAFYGDPVAVPVA
jgi:arylsulfatase A-like enzyme